MNHTDHVNLLRQGVPVSGGVWADLGAGSGAFTLALAELIGLEGKIYAVDKDGRALDQLEASMEEWFPDVGLNLIEEDFTSPLDLPSLDGIVMANSLHFVKDKVVVLRKIYDYLKPNGRLLLVEYNTDKGNKWVPYPFSFETWHNLSKRAGFIETQLLITRRSSFLGEIYSASSFKPG